MRERLLKSLRIAVTAVSLLVCGLLIVLWVRSSTHWDQLGVRLSDSLGIGLGSSAGLCDVLFTRVPPDERWFYELWPAPPIGPKWSFDQTTSRSGKWRSTYIAIPDWFLITIFATIAAFPWIKWRFSLRTLLIVLTLFAVFFGAIAMSM